MAVWMRGSASIVALAAVSVLVAGCSSASNTRNLNVVGQAPAQPSQATPVQDSTVAQSTLPPLGGATGTPAPGLAGQPVLGGVPSQSATPALTGQPGAPGTSTQVASTSGSTVSLAPMTSTVGTGPEGVWNVTAGASSCRLNLPLTQDGTTGRNRASAPGCTVSGLATVGSWQQVGNQVQLFDQSSNMIGALSQSGGQYVGTLSGGQAISMQR
jgi:hypothetical protein